MLRIIRDECQDIISEAQLLLIKKKSGISDSFDESVLRARLDKNFDDNAFMSSSSGMKMPATEFLRNRKLAFSQSAETVTSRQSHQSVIHPEMLSPEETQDLVRSVLERVSVNAWNEFQSAYNSGPHDVDISDSPGVAVRGDERYAPQGASSPN